MPDRGPKPLVDFDAFRHLIQLIDICSLFYRDDPTDRYKFNNKNDQTDIGIICGFLFHWSLSSSWQGNKAKNSRREQVEGTDKAQNFAFETPRNLSLLLPRHAPDGVMLISFGFVDIPWCAHRQNVSSL